VPGNFLRRLAGQPPRAKNYGKDVDLPRARKAQTASPVRKGIDKAISNFKFLRDKGMVGQRSPSKGR
jgi:hypothetical protein